MGIVHSYQMMAKMESLHLTHDTGAEAHIPNFIIRI